MIIYCVWCLKHIGFKEPLEHKKVIPSLCKECSKPFVLEKSTTDLMLEEPIQRSDDETQTQDE